MELDALTHLRQVAALAGIDASDAALPASHHAVMGGRRFHYLEWGAATERPPILFLHGGNQSAHTWDVVCLALSRHYHCVALDQRGHGESEWSYELDYRPEAHARDVEQLADRLGWRTFVIVGMSMGCLNALQFAGTRPERLAGFVAVDAGPYIERAGGQPIVDFVERNQSHTTLDGFVEAAMRFNTRRAPDILRHSLRHTVREMADGSYQWRADRRHKVQVDDILKWLAGARDLLPCITCPALVVRGAESKVLTHEGMLRFARELPDGGHVTIDNAGHTVQGDNPKGLIGALEAFLATRVRAG
jgi:esterase